MKVYISMKEESARGPCDTKKCTRPAFHMGRIVDLQLCEKCYRRFLTRIESSENDDA